VERECARLERRESALLARSELLEGRLGMGSGRKAGSGAAARLERSMGAREDEKALRYVGSDGDEVDLELCVMLTSI
jgi:hypothetical protein